MAALKKTSRFKSAAKLLQSSQKILDSLLQLYPDADCALHHKGAFQLMVATILSAQCTDVRVNQVTPALFQRYPDAKAFAAASLPDLEKMIHSTGFFRQKARWIKDAAQNILDRFNGQVPQTLEELLTLSGVARKTANVVLGTAFGRAQGVVVDTHVKRLSLRLGFSKQTNPVKVEQDLMRLVPQNQWIWISHALIVHGRKLCKAQRPLCAQCPLAQDCPSFKTGSNV